MQAVLQEERQQGDGQDVVLHFDENVQRGARRVLERVAYRIADHRRLVSIRTLPAQIPVFDELLGVVPDAAKWVRNASTSAAPISAGWRTS